ncbi:MAG: nucleotide exchange factor GrpE [Thermoleophilia bacterium]|nr:nucleotide exchange factor GrpE [Thermoleophilia bacterium]
MTEKNISKQQDTGKGRPGDSGRHGNDNAGREAETLAGISEEIFREAIRERDEYLDSLKRLKAEFENYRRRVSREGEQLKTRHASEIMEEILPVLDNFERAMKAAIEHDEKLLGGGVELVYNQLRGVLTKRGLCEIEAHGRPFDPEHHEAVLCLPSKEHEEGTVLDVLEKGYRVEDRVVRPAKVVVSEGKTEKK